MRHRLRRLLAVTAGLVAAVLLSGCDVTGTVTVRSDDLVDVDLRVVVDRGEPCEWVGLGGDVRTTDQRGRRGTRVCVVQGTIPKERLRRWNVAIAHTGEHIDIAFNPLGLIDGEGPATDLGVDLVDITVEFPGQVLDSNGVVSGNTVEFTGVPRLSASPALRVVALDHPGPSLGIVVPLVCFALGGLVVGLLWRAEGRRRAGDRPAMQSGVRDHDAESDGPAGPLDGASPLEAAAGRPVDGRVGWQLSPGDPDQPTGAWAGPPDGTTGWERPSEDPGGWTPPRDDSIWAPPPDRH